MSSIGNVMVSQKGELKLELNNNNNLVVFTPGWVRGNLNLYSIMVFFFCQLTEKWIKCIDQI